MLNKFAAVGLIVLTVYIANGKSPMCDSNFGEWPTIERRDTISMLNEFSLNLFQNSGVDSMLPVLDANGHKRRRQLRCIQEIQCIGAYCH